MAQLYANPSPLEGLPGPCPWHLLQPLTRTPAPRQYSRLSRSRCRVLLAPAEDGVAACLPHRSSSSASPARLKWHLALSTLPGVPGRAPGPAGTGTKAAACPRLSRDSTPQSSPAALAAPASPAATASAARLTLGGGWSRSGNAEGGGRREEVQRGPDRGREGGRGRERLRLGERKRKTHTQRERLRETETGRGRETHEGEERGIKAP